MNDCMTQGDAMNMNNEQAVSILIPLRDMMRDQYGCPISDAYFALDKAIEALKQLTQPNTPNTLNALDTISRQAAIEAIKKSRFLVDAMEKVIKLPSAQPSEIQDILDYLDTALHPIISPEHWNVYSELHDMISMLPPAQPEPAIPISWLMEEIKLLESRKNCLTVIDVAQLKAHIKRWESEQNE